MTEQETKEEMVKELICDLNPESYSWFEEQIVGMYPKTVADILIRAGWRKVK